MSELRIRCQWATGATPEEIEYHDKEWGRPCFDDRHLFEMLILEGVQAGLAWVTVLKKRAAYRRAFDQFDANKIAHYDDKKIAELLSNPGIIRNRLKIHAAITNARCYLTIVEQQSSFSDYIWQFTDGQPIVNAWQSFAQVPSTSSASEAMSKDLKKRGFKFVGHTICYAYMQATGMVNDHTTDCFCY